MRFCETALCIIHIHLGMLQGTLSSLHCVFSSTKISAEGD